MLHMKVAVANANLDNIRGEYKATINFFVRATVSIVISIKRKT